MANDFAGELLSMHSVARHNSWNIGGVVKSFYKPLNIEDCQFFLQSLPLSEKVIWLGLGSNVLFPDEFLDATIISTKFVLKGLSLVGGNIVEVSSGETCAKLAKFASNFGFGSAAFFAGIPGTIGGALAMNAGAFGGETWRYVHSVVVLSRQGELQTWLPSDFQIGYRSVSGPSGLFVSAKFQFEPWFVIDAKLMIKQLLKKRNITQPIGTLNCGSVFRNPPNNYAAKLIEGVGLKGYQIGGAKVSELHANFIINTGGAKSSDVKELMVMIVNKVFVKYNIKLEPEVKFIN